MTRNTAAILVLLTALAGLPATAQPAHHHATASQSDIASKAPPPATVGDDRGDKPGGSGDKPAPDKPGADKSAGQDASKETLQGSVEKASVTEDRVRVRDRLLPYRATAANMLMRDDAGKTRGSMFFIAYDLLEREGTPSNPRTGSDQDKASAGPSSAPAVADGDPRRRPLTFIFNGGPGAAAVWLHLGTAGPRIIRLDRDGFAPAPPYEAVENPDAWLDFSDLVFIDPVGTGFSRAAEGEKAEQFYGVTEDIRWVSEFIRLYLTVYKRWSSPKFLAGESYGTTRAAGLSEHLIDRHGITVNGIVLISSVLNFQTLRFTEGNDLPYILYLPSYAAIAWYHKRLGTDAPDLETLVRDAEAWAVDGYANALARGDALPGEDRDQVVRRLSKFTGLTADLIRKNNLRVDSSTFQNALLADHRRIVGRFDGRVTGFDLNPQANWPGYDPSLSQYLPIYSSVFNDYARRQLKYQSLLPYEVLSDKVRPWKFGEEGTGYLSVVDDLRSAMAKNPYLKIMFASGYFDLATPEFATWYTINHLDIGPLRANIVERHYLGGHMLYHYPPSRARLHDDMAGFYRLATGGS